VKVATWPRLLTGIGSLGLALLPGGLFLLAVMWWLARRGRKPPVAPAPSEQSRYRVCADCS
jgi:hypothetical protein